MNLDLCRLTMPDRAGRFAYVQNGRWVTLAESGQKVIAAPVLDDNRTACRMLVIGPAKGSRLQPITDPLEMRVAAALIELAEQTYPLVMKKRAPRFNAEYKAASFAADIGEVSIPPWKVATCLLWSQWEDDGDTIDTRAATLRELGHTQIKGDTLKDALKRDAALKLLRESKKK